MTYEEPSWGVVDPADLRRLAVVSPHFDDAAMGAGHLVASYPGTTVITVLGGRPPAYPSEPTSWDAAGGFAAGDDVVAVRQEEDREAMALLGALPVWLDHPDHQYLAPHDRPTPEVVAPSLEEAIVAADPSAVFVPMGLGNPDHVVTHEASLLVRERHLDLAWFCYEDHGYKHIPGLLSWRVARLLRSRPWATPAIIPHTPDEELKRRVIYCYRSQIGPLDAEHALSQRLGGHVPEQFWRLAAPPAGWEGLSELI